MNIGLCSGRHVVNNNEGEEMDHYLFSGPVEHPTHVDIIEKVCREFIRDYIMVNPRTDLPRRRIHLYITGLTPLLTSFLKSWVEQQERLEMTCGDLILWHWDTETKQYVPQKWAMIT
jgi:hypothetical protein